MRRYRQQLRPRCAEGRVGGAAGSHDAETRLRAEGQEHSGGTDGENQRQASARSGRRSSSWCRLQFASPDGQGVFSGTRGTPADHCGGADFPPAIDAGTRPCAAVETAVPRPVPITRSSHPKKLRTTVNCRGEDAAHSADSVSEAPGSRSTGSAAIATEASSSLVQRLAATLASVATRPRRSVFAPLVRSLPAGPPTVAGRTLLSA
jgi:hypothetical protein